METNQTIATLLFVFVLLYFDIVSVYSCQPPDLPEGGSYIPVHAKYLPGDKVVYTCKDKLTLIGRDTRLCQTTGKWTGATPFCDSPTAVRNPTASTDPYRSVSNLVDGSPNTCFRTKNATGQNVRMHLDPPAPVNIIKLYVQKGRINFRISLFQSRPKTSGGTLCVAIEREIEESQWLTLECNDTEYHTDYVIIQDSSPKATVMAICEIEFFVKDDDWCKHPPDVFIPHGRLEISRNKASLRCADGYREGQNIRMVCEKNAWAGINLQCEEIDCDLSVGNGSQLHGDWKLLNGARKFSVGTQRKLECNQDFKIVGNPEVVICLKHGSWSSTTATCIPNIPDNKTNFKVTAIVVGSVIVALVFFLLGLTIFLILKKKPRKVVVIYKPSEDGYTPPSINSTVASSEAEYSQVYYDVTHKPAYPPIPVRPTPKLNNELYSKPFDASTTTLNNTSTLPADIAFGTLKSSSLYE